MKVYTCTSSPLGVRCEVQVLCEVRGHVPDEAHVVRGGGRGRAGSGGGPGAQGGPGPTPTEKDVQAGAAITEAAAAAADRQRRRAIPVQGDFFMPADAAGADAEVGTLPCM